MRERDEVVWSMGDRTWPAQKFDENLPHLQVWRMNLGAP
jgi:hypothetical protein